MGRAFVPKICQSFLARCGGNAAVVSESHGALYNRPASRFAADLNRNVNQSRRILCTCFGLGEQCINVEMRVFSLETAEHLASLTLIPGLNSILYSGANL